MKASYILDIPEDAVLTFKECPKCNGLLYLWRGHLICLFCQEEAFHETIDRLIINVDKLQGDSQ